MDNFSANPKWTRQREEQLRELILMDLTSSQAARILGVTRNACLGKAQRLGVRFHERKHGLAPLKARQAKARPPRLAKPPKVVDFTPTQSGVPIWGLENWMCRWVTGDPRDIEALRYCGERVTAPGKSWCEAHGRVLTIPGSARKIREPRDEKRAAVSPRRPVCIGA